MITLALEPIGGIAGDMLIAALLHLGAPRSALDDGLRKLSLFFEFSAEEVEVSGSVQIVKFPVLRLYSQVHSQGW